MSKERVERIFIKRFVLGSKAIRSALPSKVGIIRTPYNKPMIQDKVTLPLARSTRRLRNAGEMSPPRGVAEGPRKLGTSVVLTAL